MASDRSFVAHVLERLSCVEEIAARPMMGDYVLYHHGKVVGGIYDDRLLVKNTPGARACLPEPELQLPYPGAKPMLVVDPDEDRERLKALFSILHQELPALKRKK